MGPWALLKLQESDCSTQQTVQTLREADLGASSLFPTWGTSTPAPALSVPHEKRGWGWAHHPGTNPTEEAGVPWRRAHDSADASPSLGRGLQATRRHCAGHPGGPVAEVTSQSPSGRVSVPPCPLLGKSQLSKPLESATEAPSAS